VRVVVAIAVLAAGCDALLGIDTIPAVDASSNAQDAQFSGARMVFVTPGTYSGGFATGDPLSFADSLICGQLVTDQDLPGTWKAWLSTSHVDAVSRFRPGGGPIVLTDHTTVVASSWAEMLSAPLLHEIDLAQDGSTMVSTGCGVWTNTDQAGMRVGNLPSQTCDDWSDASITQSPGEGDANSTMTWSHDTSCSVPCSGKLHVYCFQD